MLACSPSARGKTAPSSQVLPSLAHISWWGSRQHRRTANRKSSELSQPWEIPSWRSEDRMREDKVREQQNSLKERSMQQFHARTREISKAGSGMKTRVQGCDTEDHRNLGVSNTEKNENGGYWEKGLTRLIRRKKHIVTIEMENSGWGGDREAGDQDELLRNVCFHSRTITVEEWCWKGFK